LDQGQTQVVEIVSSIRSMLRATIRPDSLGSRLCAAYMERTSMSRSTGWVALGLAVTLLLASSAASDDSSGQTEGSAVAAAQAEIHATIEAIVSDAEAANLEGLMSSHLDSPMFSKFGPRTFERQDVTSTNASEAAFFGSIANYKQEIRDLKIDVFGDVGIATFYPHVSFEQDGQEKFASGRQTFVFLKTDDGWKLVHEHGTPRP
jgi:ketosteroid isomerase-like protein